MSNGYTAQGWLSSVSTLQGTTTTQLLSGAAYTGVGGGFGDLTAASLGNSTYSYSATYDLLDRATDLRVTRSSDGSSRFEEQRTFDAAGNVSTQASTLPGGTDDQAFCYDEQDRLTWAGSVGTPPCTGTAISAGTLTAAQYTQSFTYDAMGRLATGPLGSYAYRSSPHVHAATSIGTQYTASYDAAGNMTCRAPSASSTCTGGSPNGAQLAYDNEGRLATWQNQPTSPTSTASFLYDGSGQRVAQQTTTAGTTTLTAYVGDLEEVSTTGSSTTTTAYYYAGGKRIGLSVNGTISYLADDGLGSADVALNAGGMATASQLFAPYGTVRYSSGTVPGTYGFTGQRTDAISGLDYYMARYYDALAGQFTSGDAVLPGGGVDVGALSRYAYVECNPEARTDPTGHINLSVGDDGSAVPIQNAFQGTYSWGGSPTPTYHAGLRAAYPAARSRMPAATSPQQGLSGPCSGAACARLQQARDPQPQVDNPIVDFLNEQILHALVFVTFGAGGPEAAGAIDGGDAATVDTGLSFADQSAILRAASTGKGDFGLGSATKAQADELGRAWVGDAYHVASDGKTLVSADGLRQYRPPTYKPREAKAQANFERRLPGQTSSRWQSNGHLDITDWP